MKGSSPKGSKPKGGKKKLVPASGGGGPVVGHYQSLIGGTQGLSGGLHS